MSVTALLATASGLMLHGTAANACDLLVVPTVAIERCAVAGDQPQIDEGNVVRVDRLSSAEFHWLAGHRTSHGSVFGPLTDLHIGDLVGYRDHVYRVSEYLLVDRDQPDAVDKWFLANQPAVVLQTSASGGFVHVWYAQLTDLSELVAQYSQPAMPADAPAIPAQESVGRDTANPVPAGAEPDGPRSVTGRSESIEVSGRATDEPPAPACARRPSACRRLERWFCRTAPARIDDGSVSTPSGPVVMAATVRSRNVQLAR